MVALSTPPRIRGMVTTSQKIRSIPSLSGYLDELGTGVLEGCTIPLYMLLLRTVQLMSFRGSTYNCAQAS